MGEGTDGPAAPGRSPALDAGQLEVLRRYGTERDVAAGEVLFADGDETYDLIVMLDGTAEIIQGYGRPGATLIAGYSRSQFLGEIGMLTGQRAYLTAVATSAGRVLAVPAARLRVVMGARTRPQRPDLAHLPAPALDPDAPRGGPDPDRLEVRSRYPAAAGGTGA